MKAEKLYFHILEKLLLAIMVIRSPGGGKGVLVLSGATWWCIYKLDKQLPQIPEAEQQITPNALSLLVTVVRRWLGVLGPKGTVKGRFGELSYDLTSPLSQNLPPGAEVVILN